jgi:hypothetical protein
MGISCNYAGKIYLKSRQQVFYVPAGRHIGVGVFFPFALVRVRKKIKCPVACLHATDFFSLPRLPSL